MTSTPMPKVERRRTIRIKRSGLLRWKLDDIDRPAIKIAETEDEMEQAFRLVHDTYLQMGYLKEPTKTGMLFSIYSLLPETVIFIAKSYLTVISTLTEIFDTELFGLPMDVIYQSELDQLRRQGRKIVELSALVTPAKLRWRNLFMYLSQVMYQYSIYRGVDDLCIAVNPKHVRFYKNILLFEDLGPERHYPRVDAPAVALRVDMHSIADKLKETYGSLDFDCNLYAYFHRITGQSPAVGTALEYPVPADPAPRDAIVNHFLRLDPSMVESLDPRQRKFLKSVYPELEF